MRILSLRTIEGPNVYHHQPILVLKVDLEDWVNRGSHEVPALRDALLRILPGLGLHHCSPGYEGGFVERLWRGTYPAHIVEHIALELSALAGIPVQFGKTRYAGQGSHYEIAVRYKNEPGMRACLFQAFNLFQALSESRLFDLQEALNLIKREVSRGALGPTTEALLAAARSRGIPVRVFAESSLLQMGYGRGLRRFQAAVSDRTSLIAADLVQDKELTKRFLEDILVPVPKGASARHLDEIEGILKGLEFPVVVKPLDGHHGNGVFLGLRNPAEVREAFLQAQRHGSTVLIEEMVPGRDYRALVVNGRLVAMAERTPPRVEGDGQSTIEDLMRVLNADPRRGVGHEGCLSRVEPDEGVRDCLARQGWDLKTVLPRGQTAVLRAQANLSGGGEAEDVTDRVHPAVRVLCERIGCAVNLDICGIDLIHRDIGEPPSEGLRVIEVNAAPGLRMHLAPSKGPKRPVAEEIVNMVYPEGTDGRIPIAAVTGTNGKTTLVRLLRKMFTRDPKLTVGMTTTDGIWIGTDQVASGDTTGPQSARAVLGDPRVDVAILEVARGGILRGGLGYDWSDIAVITNIRPDHIGQDGIEDLEDLVWIKSLVAERVKEGGTLILNADDEEALNLKFNPRAAKRRVVLYSTRSLQPDIQDHIAEGGEAYWCDEGQIRSHRDGTVETLAFVRDFPFTMDGKASFQVSNALGAIAAGRAMGLRLEDVLAGLREFNPSMENRGRANLYQIGGGYLFLDYGHNPDAIAAVGNTLSEWKGYRKTAVFGVPGDRSDELLRASAARILPFFDRVILRDDLDLRGRSPGEVPRLLEEVFRDDGRVPCEVVLNEIEAVDRVLSGMGRDEIAVVFYDEFEPVMRKIRQFDPKPVSGLPAIAGTSRLEAHSEIGPVNHPEREGRIR